MVPFSTMKLTWGLTFPQAPKLDFGIANEGWKHKFWKFEAQMAQIKHKFLAPFPTPKLNWGVNTSSAPQTCFWYSEWRMKTQILKVWSTNSTNYAQIFDSVPNLLPHFGGASISSTPKTDKLIVKSGEKHKLWDSEAQIAQIFRSMFDPLPYFEGVSEMELKYW